MKTIWELCLDYRAAMPAPTAHANHVLLAIPNRKVQGLRVGDIATDVLQTLVDVWVIPFGPFVVGSGRAKDANAITLELRDRMTCPRCKSKTPMKGGICQNYGCESPKRGERSSSI